jgi:hypothetical protein
MMKHKAVSRRQRCRHTQIHLPPLDPDEALMLVGFLEKAVQAVWRAHGDAMSDHLGCVSPDSMSRPYDAIWCGKDTEDGDDHVF